MSVWRHCSWARLEEAKAVKACLEEAKKARLDMAENRRSEAEKVVYEEEAEKDRVACLEEVTEKDCSFRKCLMLIGTCTVRKF